MQKVHLEILKRAQRVDLIMYVGWVHMPIHLKRTKISTILMNGGKVRYYKGDINKTNPNTNNNAIHTIQSSWERNLNLMDVKNEVLTRQKEKTLFHTCVS